MYRLLNTSFTCQLNHSIINKAFFCNFQGQQYFERNQSVNITDTLQELEQQGSLSNKSIGYYARQLGKGANQINRFRQGPEDKEIKQRIIAFKNEQLSDLNQFSEYEILEIIFLSRRLKKQNFSLLNEKELNSLNEIISKFIEEQVYNFRNLVNLCFDLMILDRHSIACIKRLKDYMMYEPELLTSFSFAQLIKTIGKFNYKLHFNKSFQLYVEQLAQRVEFYIQEMEPNLKITTYQELVSSQNHLIGQNFQVKKALRLLSADIIQNIDQFNDGQLRRFYQFYLQIGSLDFNQFQTLSKKLDENVEQCGLHKLFILYFFNRQAHSFNSTNIQIYFKSLNAQIIDKMQNTDQFFFMQYNLLLSVFKLNLSIDMIQTIEKNINNLKDTKIEKNHILAIQYCNGKNCDLTQFYENNQDNINNLELGQQLALIQDIEKAEEIRNQLMDQINQLEGNVQINNFYVSNIKNSSFDFTNSYKLRNMWSEILVSFLEKAVLIEREQFSIFNMKAILLDNIIRLSNYKFQELDRSLSEIVKNQLYHEYIYRLKLKEPCLSLYKNEIPCVNKILQQVSESMAYQYISKTEVIQSYIQTKSYRKLNEVLSMLAKNINQERYVSMHNYVNLVIKVIAIDNHSVHSNNLNQIFLSNYNDSNKIRIILDQVFTERQMKEDIAESFYQSNKDNKFLKEAATLNYSKVINPQDLDKINYQDILDIKEKNLNIIMNESTYYQKTQAFKDLFSSVHIKFWKDQQEDVLQVFQEYISRTSYVDNQFRFLIQIASSKMSQYFTYFSQIFEITTKNILEKKIQSLPKTTNQMLAKLNYIRFESKLEFIKQIESKIIEEFKITPISDSIQLMNHMSKLICPTNLIETILERLPSKKPAYCNIIFLSGILESGYRLSQEQYDMIASRIYVTKQDLQSKKKLVKYMIDIIISSDLLNQESLVLQQLDQLQSFNEKPSNREPFILQCGNYLKNKYPNFQEHSVLAEVKQEKILLSKQMPNKMIFLDMLDIKNVSDPETDDIAFSTIVNDNIVINPIYYREDKTISNRYRRNHLLLEQYYPGKQVLDLDLSVLRKTTELQEKYDMLKELFGTEVTFEEFQQKFESQGVETVEIVQEQDEFGDEDFAEEVETDMVEEIEE